MSCCIVVSNISHDRCPIHVIMHEASKKGFLLFRVDMSLGFPMRVSVPQPCEIIV